MRKLLLIPTALIITSTPIISLVGCGDNRTPKQNYIELTGSSDLEVNPQTQSAKPEAFLTFNILSGWEEGCELVATFKNVSQIGGYLKEYQLVKLASEQTATVINNVATVPVAFVDGPLYGGDTSRPEDNTKVQFEVDLACYDGPEHDDSHLKWSVVHKQLLGKKFTISYNYSPWTADEITGDENVVSIKYGSSVQLTTHRLYYNSDQVFVASDVEDIVFIVLNGQSEPEILREMESEVAMDEDETGKYLQFTIHWDVDKWPSGSIYKNFYLGVNIPNDQQATTAPCYLHWDQINLHFEKAS